MYWPRTFLTPLVVSIHRYTPDRTLREEREA
jgi:hypothetical protein